MNRRRFLSNLTATSAGFFGMHALLTGGADAAPAPTFQSDGYGPLIEDPHRIIDLPEGFEYRVFSRKGDQMDDGLLVPGLHDGMAAFAGPNGKTILVRNHELRPTSVESGAFGEENSLLSKLDRDFFYDYGNGEAPGLGGTTTMVYDTRTHRLEKHWMSLAGTIRNCAGGPTPWGSWVSCEETTMRKGGPVEKDHGFNFEVPITTEKAVEPVALTEMGRFNHEAIAVHPPTGIVYQTEDRPDGLIYRYIPNKPGELHRGGKLQAMALADLKSGDTRNWDKLVLNQGEPVAVRWIDIKNVLSPEDDLRDQGFDSGGCRFARGEGIWTGDDGEIYFACTNGGKEKAGQVFRYRPSPDEGKKAESKNPGKLELFLESPDRRLLEYCDNLTVAPWGDLVLCEDGDGVDHIIGVTPDAKVYKLGKNALNDGELTGSCFSPDGTTLFVNIQGVGWTLAITGPWSRRAA